MFGINKKKNPDDKDDCWIYIKFGWYQESGDYDMKRLGLEDLSFKEAELKLMQIKEKCEKGIVEIYETKQGRLRLINWRALQDAYIDW